MFHPAQNASGGPTFLAFAFPSKPAVLFRLRDAVDSGLFVSVLLFVLGRDQCINGTTHAVFSGRHSALPCTAEDMEVALSYIVFPHVYACTVRSWPVARLSA